MGIDFVASAEAAKKEPRISKDSEGRKSKHTWLSCGRDYITEQNATRSKKDCPPSNNQHRLVRNEKRGEVGGEGVACGGRYGDNLRMEMFSPFCFVTKRTS